jgi:hypothetical protein
MSSMRVSRAFSNVTVLFSSNDPGPWWANDGAAIRANAATKTLDRNMDHLPRSALRNFKAPAGAI